MSSSSDTASEAEVYDRQIRLWGLEAQRRMRSSHVLIAGFRALNAELCKNLVLAGINVTVQDADTVAPQDVGAQFFLQTDDIGKNRAVASVERVRELNPLVKVCVETKRLESLDKKFFAQFSAICCSDVALPTQLRINELCRARPCEKPIAFFATGSFGHTASLFCDLGRHEYLRPVLKRPAGDIGEGNAPTHERCVLEFPSLAEAVAAPWKPLNAHKRKRVPEAFYALRVLQEAARCGGMEGTLETLLGEQNLTSAFCSIDTVMGLVKASNAGTELAPVCAVMGGIVGQEVIKAISGKDKPVCNFFFFDGITGAGVVRRIPNV